jgi:hypothetical protein
VLNIFFNPLFWGAALAAIGALKILKIWFKLEIPIYTLVTGILLLYVGSSFVWSGFFAGPSRTTLFFGEQKIIAKAIDEIFTLVSCQTSIDTSGITPKNGVIKKKLNAFYGSYNIAISSAAPTKVIARALFSNVILPDKNTVSFGQYIWQSDSLKNTDHYVLIEVNVVLGSVSFEKTGEGGKPVSKKKPGIE